MELIFKLIAIASLACCIASFWFYRLWHFFKILLKVKRLKPLDCDKCMAFWLNLAYFHFIEGKDFLFIFATGAVASILAMLIKSGVDRFTIR